MADSVELAEELWEAIVAYIPARRRQSAARALIDVLESNDCEDVEASKMYAVAYDEDEDFDEVFDEDE